mmetsp:Transcript_14074/g.30567  ORF Transcript_14074/g.30567 Transcript_14074/m.30567 type:complete len:323 (-) Transcript_14074:259-1227(-)
MSHVRQRRRAANDEDHPAPDLLECESYERSVDDGDRGAARNRNGRANDRDEGETKPFKRPPDPNNAPGEPCAIDRFLSAYVPFSSATFTADQGLKILQWSSWAVSYATRRSSRYADLSEGLRALYGEISFTRYVLRFYGLLSSLEGYRSGSWAGGTWDDPVIAKVAKYLMAGSMLVYYPLEHAAYAGWKMPSLARRVDANKMSAISCVFWTSYIVGDFWASFLKWKELRRKLGHLREVLAGRKKDDDKGALTDLPKEEHTMLSKIRHVKLQMLRCLLFILPAINWSLPNWATDPLLGEFPLNGLMLAEAYTSVYQSLRSMCG